MLSRSSGKLWFVVVLLVIFVFWPVATAAGLGSIPHGSGPDGGISKARLTEGFHEVLRLLEQRGFSLLAVWREMRRSDDPEYFDRNYPQMSTELNAWAASVEKRVGMISRDFDLSFVVEEFGPIVLDREVSPVMRDNALATICVICTMDDLRCRPEPFHTVLAEVVVRDTSAARKAEALRWWRRTGGSIGEDLLEEILSSAARLDLELRGEIAKTLFSIGTRRSLEVQRLLSGTSGLPEDPSGSQAQIACTAIRHFARDGYEPAVPDVIEALQDPSVEVRACAAESITRLSGQDFGFDPDSDRLANADAISRYRAWWEQRAAGDGEVEQ